uniref:RegA n=1 Tax=Platydorina caudata TaxID=51709 RepID=A0A1W5IXF8_9CHLO|nr:regA [Platydorina caudata]
MEGESGDDGVTAGSQQPTPPPVETLHARWPSAPMQAAPVAASAGAIRVQPWSASSRRPALALRPLNPAAALPRDGTPRGPQALLRPPSRDDAELLVLGAWYEARPDSPPEVDAALQPLPDDKPLGSLQDDKPSGASTPKIVLRPVRSLQERAEGHNTGAAPCWPGSFQAVDMQQQQLLPLLPPQPPTRLYQAPSVPLDQTIRRPAGARTPQYVAMDASKGGPRGSPAEQQFRFALPPLPPIDQQQEMCRPHLEQQQQQQQGPPRSLSLPPQQPVLESGGLAALQLRPGAGVDDIFAAEHNPELLTEEASANIPPGPIEVTVAMRVGAGGSRKARGGGRHADEDSRSGYVRGHVSGLFDITRYLADRDCIHNGSRWMSRSHFEKVGGSKMAKWYRSIRVLPDLEPIGEWLERHGLAVTKGPARRSRKRAADSGDEQGSGQGQELARIDSMDAAASLAAHGAAVPTAASLANSPQQAALPDYLPEHAPPQVGAGGTRLSGGGAGAGGGSGGGGYMFVGSGLGSSGGGIGGGSGSASGRFLQRLLNTLSPLPLLSPLQQPAESTEGAARSAADLPGGQGRTWRLAAPGSIRGEVATADDDMQYFNTRSAEAKAGRLATGGDSSLGGSDVPPIRWRPIQAIRGPGPAHAAQHPSPRAQPVQLVEPQQQQQPSQPPQAPLHPSPPQLPQQQQPLPPSHPHLYQLRYSPGHRSIHPPPTDKEGNGASAMGSRGYAADPATRPLMRQGWLRDTAPGLQLPPQSDAPRFRCFRQHGDEEHARAPAGIEARELVLDLQQSSRPSSGEQPRLSARQGSVCHAVHSPHNDAGRAEPYLYTLPPSCAPTVRRPGSMYALGAQGLVAESELDPGGGGPRAAAVAPSELNRASDQPRRRLRAYLPSELGGRQVRGEQPERLHGADDSLADAGYRVSEMGLGHRYSSSVLEQAEEPREAAGGQHGVNDQAVVPLRQGQVAIQRLLRPTLHPIGAVSSGEEAVGLGPALRSEGIQPPYADWPQSRHDQEPR